MSATNLWPEDITNVGDIRAPMTFLKEQAAFLGLKTKNNVEANVVSANSYEGWMKGRSDVVINFVITAPSINYRYTLFTVSHRLVELYPVLIKVDEDLTGTITFSPNNDRYYKSVYEISSEAQLSDILRQIFDAPKTKRIVQALLVQMGANTQ